MLIILLLILKTIYLVTFARKNKPGRNVTEAATRIVLPLDIIDVDAILSSDSDGVEKKRKRKKTKMSHADYLAAQQFDSSDSSDDTYSGSSEEDIEI
jgi:hypothetical protein